MTTQKNEPLAPLTSFDVGGPAKRLVTLTENDRLPDALNDLRAAPQWVLGYGTNVLISDEGLLGTTLLLRNDQVDVAGETIVAGAGAWWDDVVKAAAAKGLWGIELMSGIPGGVGAGVFININAYGQALADTVEWVEAWDPDSLKLRRFTKTELTWGYKRSPFQEPNLERMVITRASFSLSRKQTTPLTYQSALDVAKDFKVDVDTLVGRRQVILETRRQAESIFVPGQGDSKSVGSFFRNPLVTQEQAERVVVFDESNKTRKQIEEMNRVHGGEILRVSASHVLLAAGFSRGQSWGNVRLHPRHVLKIENTGGATAQEIYDVAQEIMKTVKDKLGIDLEPEARILGEFQ